MEESRETYRSTKARSTDRELMSEVDADVEDSGRSEIDDYVPDGAHQVDPTDPDGKHKDKPTTTQARHKPYRTIDRTRPK